jgi:hypothetical protein
VSMRAQKNIPTSNHTYINSSYNFKKILSSTFLYDWRGIAMITTASTPRATRRRGVRYARGPRRTLCSHDCQRAPRKLSVHAVVLCASCSPVYCPGASRPRQACSRLTSRFRVASYCRRVDLECD